MLDRTDEAVALHRVSCSMLQDLVGSRHVKTVTAKEHLAQTLAATAAGAVEAVALLQQCRLDRAALQGEGTKPVAAVLPKLAVRWQGKCGPSPSWCPPVAPR